MYGKYQCPGGHIENESRYNALIRELHEETSLTPNETLKFEFEYSFNVQDDIYDNGTRIVYVFKMTTDQIPINMEPEKHDDWKSYSKNDLKKLLVIDTLKEYLSRYKKNLRILFEKIISIILIFWNIVEISIETIMKLRLINKNYDKLISNWIRPYKISVQSKFSITNFYITNILI